MPITRIVKMHFQAQAAEAFAQFAHTIQPTISSFEGCLHLQILRDTTHPTLYFSYSVWQSDQALQAYRQSDFFRQTWAQTKQGFAEPAQAWTVQGI